MYVSPPAKDAENNKITMVVSDFKEPFIQVKVNSDNTFSF